MNLTKKLRFLLRFLSAVIKKQYKLVFIGLILGGLSFFLIPKVLYLIPQAQRTVKIGIVGQFSLDNLPPIILDDISVGLTKTNESGEAIPAISESWNTSDEGKSFTFNVDSDDLLWHDNKIFEVKDINYNFKDITISASDNEITFNLKEPFSPFPIILSKPLFRKGLIGLGNYKVKKIINQGKFVQSISLTAFKDKSLPNKLYHFYPSENDLITGFNLGEIDEASGIFDTNGISSGKNIVISKNIMNNAFLALYFDTSKPAFSDKSYRQALAYSIKKESGDIRALTPINPRSFAYNPDVKPYKQDVTNAKKLIGEGSEATEKIVISTLPQYRTMAEEIVNDWKEINVSAEVKIVSIVPEDFDALLIAREIPADPDQYYFWHSTQAGNLSKFKNPRIDKLLEDGRKTFDKEERKSIYFDFQRFLTEESPAVFLSHPVTYSIIRGQ